MKLYQPRPLRNKSSLQIDMNYAAADFARLIAKIALGYAVAAHPTIALKDVSIKDIILGDVSQASTKIGGWTGNLAFDQNTVHAASTSVADDQVCVVLQLFRPPPGLAQTPAYQVLIGHNGQPLPAPTPFALKP